VRLRLGPGEGLLPDIQRYGGEQALVAGTHGPALVDEDLAVAIDHAVGAQPFFDQRHGVRGAAFQRNHAADTAFELAEQPCRLFHAWTCRGEGDRVVVEDDPASGQLDDALHAHGWLAPVVLAMPLSSAGPVRNSRLPRKVTCRGAGMRSSTSTGRWNRPSAGLVTDSSKASAPNRRSGPAAMPASRAADSSRDSWVERRLIMRSPQPSGCSPRADRRSMTCCAERAFSTFSCASCWAICAWASS